MIALGRELAARGHEVVLQTWEKWRPHVEGEGIRFERAPEYAVFPSSPALKPYQAGPFSSGRRKSSSDDKAIRSTAFAGRVSFRYQFSVQ